MKIRQYPIAPNICQRVQQKVTDIVGVKTIQKSIPATQHI